MEHVHGLKIGENYFNNLCTDDTVLVTGNEKYLQEILMSRKFGLLMNVEKTRIKVFSESNYIYIPLISITIDGKRVERVTSFQY